MPFHRIFNPVCDDSFSTHRFGRCRVTDPAPDRLADAGEIQLPMAELFVSRTDRRGVLQSGNAVFQRISGFPWDRLLGAPHRIIRHPDMPAGVFQLFWDWLLEGRKIGAFVRNSTVDGRHYWVFAVALPAPEGFVSVRMRPSGPLFEMIRPIYADLRRREREEGLSPADSRDLFLATLLRHGHDSYGTFMSAAMEEVFAARGAALQRNDPPRVAQARRLGAAVGTARRHAARIAALFEEIRGVPTNIRILAAQLERGGGPIGVISTNHTTLSEEMLAGVAEFRDATTRTAGIIGDGLFLACTSALVGEIAEIHLREESLPPGIDAAAEARILQQLDRQCHEAARSALAGIPAQAEIFAKLAHGVKRHVTGLDVTRIMCKIENARLAQGTSGLSEIIDNLEDVQARIARELAEIERASRTILAAARPRGLAHVA